MDFDEINVFLKVVEYHKLTDAAYSLNMSQPTVSNILRRMEKELDIRLFIRHGKKLVLTNQGRLFYEAAKNLAFSYGQATDCVRLGHGNKQEVHIATSVTSDLFYNISSAFAAAHPEIRLAFRSERLIPSNHRLCSADFRLIEKHCVQDEDSIEIDVQNNLFVILRNDHPLAHERTVPLQRLSNEYFVFLHNEQHLYETSYFCCLRAGFQPKVALSVSSYAEKYAAIGVGCGIGLAYDSENALPLTLNGYTAIPVRGNWEGYPICLAWYDSRLSASGRTFLEYVRHYLSR